MVPVDTLAIVIAFGLDRTIQEFPTPIHPVAIHGRLYDVVDRQWSHPLLIGGIIALLFPIIPAGIAYSLTIIAVGIHWILGSLVAGLVLFTVTSYNRLLSIASEIVTTLDTDIAQAKQQLPALVGRDPSDLTVDEVHSAILESIAENLSDGLVAPLLGFVLLSYWSVPVGVGVAVWIKSVNTGDSMLGYHAKPHGTASARLMIS
jgi:adenosylcobinamide-phosphate synthase